jgi:hypothetical protein
MSSKRESRAEQRKRQRKLKFLAMMFVGGTFLLLAAFLVIKPYLPVIGGTILSRGGPQLKVDQEKVDLGDVRFENLVSASFQVTNVGDQPLRFTKSPYVEVMEGC